MKVGVGLFCFMVLLSLSYCELSGPLNTLKKELSKQKLEEADSEEEESPIDGIIDNEKIYQTVGKRMNKILSHLNEEHDRIYKNVQDADIEEDKEETSKDMVDKEEVTQLAILQVQKWMKTLTEFGQNLDVSLVEGEEDNQELLDQLSAVSEQPEEADMTPEGNQANGLYQIGLGLITKGYGHFKVSGYQYIQMAADAGHKDAKIKLAWATLFGNFVTQNISMTTEIFQTLAEEGNADAHTGLGLLYAAGIGLNVSQSKALVHLHFGALGDNTWAQMALGYRFWAGVTVPVNCEKALDYYRKAATKVAKEVSFSGGAAIQRIKLLDEHDSSGFSSGMFYSNLIEYYQLLAEKGDIQTQVGLGQLHYQGGRGVPLDIKKAMHYFSRAANAGNAEAMAFLGKIYLEGGESVEASNETALRYFRKSAELNNPVGQAGLGLMYLHGRGVPKDTNQALKYFKLAADQGWVDGQLQLGNMYFGGIGVRRDFKLANKYFSLASQSGHVLAYYHLGQMHAQGMGMMASCPTAVELFKNVAERGKWGEQLMLAYNDYKQFNSDQAFVQYAILAQLGYEVAQSNAAFLLDRGEVELFNGPPEDYIRALTFWSRAAAQGYAAAQVKLGDYHYYGLGTPVDYETAASHYRLASDQQHNAQAMFNLGYMHEQGLGMRRDVHLAKRCYDLAAETSIDAKVPVALALLKLFLVFNMESVQEYLQSPLSPLFAVDEEFLSNWDIYLITILTGLLGFVIYFRRPRVPQQGNNNVNNNNNPQ